MTSALGAPLEGVKDTHPQQSILRFGQQGKPEVLFQRVKDDLKPWPDFCFINEKGYWQFC